MLTRLIIRNFKRFGEVDIELGNPVVFVGPNNSGKTSALQALALWDVGLKKWNEKRKGKQSPEKRPGVTINRKDLIAAPVPDANLLWRAMHVRDVQKSNGKQITSNIRIDIIVEGIIEDKPWKCGLEFDYANEESFYCRPLRRTNENNPKRMPIPEIAGKVKVAYLPPMSGLAAIETHLGPGAINVRVGEGRTAEVLRNLCYRIFTNNNEKWGKLVEHIRLLFGSELESPVLNPVRGEISMSYKEKNSLLDLSSSGRGLQQTLLLLAYMYDNPGAVLLLDEPDAHLEILRQRQIYQILTDVAIENENQIIAASHSEVLLNEAADRDVVIAFVGKPHRINDRGSQVLKSLKDIGFEDYYLAEQTGWVLYLEGSTDLAILKAFAELLNNSDAQQVLEMPFIHYVCNQPNDVRKHFFGLKEAVPHLKGIALFDRLTLEIPDDLGAIGMQWKRKEIENYLCLPETLENYARATVPPESYGSLFASAESDKRITIMKKSIEEIAEALGKLKGCSPWDSSTKVSEDFLEPLFKEYFKKLKLPNIMSKNNFHELAKLVPSDKIDFEVSEKLNEIVRVAKSATPAPIS